MPTRVKICGIKTKEEVAIINQFPLNYVGLIFAPSKRQVTVENARLLRKLIRKDIEVVGVFVNETVETINAIVEGCSLQVVQLHGEESVDDCSAIQAKVWKTISVKDEESLKLIEHYAPFVEGILLDTYSPLDKGGTGKQFNWEMVVGLSEKYSIILAGGLTPDNVVEAIEIVKPQIVDMNSGLETAFIKDFNKIERVFKRLKEAKINE